MDQDTNTEAEELVYGIVEEALPNTHFRIAVEGEPEPVLAYLSGRMRRFRIRVLVGDKVGLVIDPYGGKRASLSATNHYESTIISQTNV